MMMRAIIAVAACMLLLVGGPGIVLGQSDPNCTSAAGTSVTSLHGGTVLVNPDHTITYTPAPGFFGIDSFDYTICDGEGGYDTATVTIIVNGLPIALNDSAKTNEAQPITVDVLINDTDPEGGVLSVQQVTPGVAGVTTLEGNKVVYTPNAGFVGRDVFSYSVSDEDGGVSEAKVAVVVRRKDWHNGERGGV